MFQTFADEVLGVMNFIIPLGVALSTFGCALSIQFSVTRLCYVAATEGHMVEAFSYIHMRRLTPAPAVVLQVSNSKILQQVLPKSDEHL
jgi:L-type amino acid transporter 9